MKKEMLINVLQPEECRIAIVEDGVLEELYVERTSHESYVGNIYKGRIVNIEPSIQAAFVDFGVGRNGFLHVSDVEPAYYRHLTEGRRQESGRREGREGREGRGRHGRGRHAEEDSPRPSGRGRGPQEPRRHRPEPLDEEPLAEETHRPEEYLPAEEAAVPEEYHDPESRSENEGAALAGAAPTGLTEEAPGREMADAAAEGSEEPAEAEGSKARRRPRGRGRRPREEAAPQAAETGPEDETAAEAEPPTEPEAGAERSRKAPERPRPMDSAERRTKEEDMDLGPASSSGASSSSAADEFGDEGPEEEGSPSEPEDAFDHAEDDLYPEVDNHHAPEVEEDDEPGPRQESLRGAGEEDEFFEDMLPEGRLPEYEPEGEGSRPRRRREGDGRGRGRRNGGRRGPGRPGMGRPKPLIQDIFRRGQEVLVQVIKEGIGTKGPTLSTYISIAGRYLVLMPGLNRIGVSRKITDEEQRRRLKEILNDLQPPKGLGFIIRTAGLDRTKKELQRDLAYLSRLWQVVVRRIRKLKAPAEIYQESDMITRTIRDTFTSEIDTIWVDEPGAFEHAQEFLQIVMPRYATRIQRYDAPEPMFHKYGIEDEISRIQQKHVPLPNGGSIVIEQTEALVAIDVNSGNFRADNNAEETAYQMNLLAAREIARQLRLRDLGGVIVNDFIDMREEKHRRGVEKAMRDAVKRDRARTKILKISAFGIIEMTRQRIRPSLKRSIYQDCPHCHGNGQVKTCESMSIDVMRMLQLAAHREHIHRIHVRVHGDVSSYLLNRKRQDIARLEDAAQTLVVINSAADVSPEFLEFTCYDNNNNEVKFLAYDEPRPRRR
jgi:ribonuclease E